MSDTPVVPASPREIVIFKQGAAARYKERGVSPAQANQLFDAHIEKMASELGVTQPVLTPKVVKLATVLKQAIVASRE